MATELEPGVFAMLMGRIDIAGVRNAGKALTAVAYVIEKQAKINASTGSHRYGTPTPAWPGTGPAVVSGNLRRSITHTRVARVATGWEILIGTAGGFYPPYPYRSRSGGPPKRTASSKYGLYLEKTGLRNGVTYPFLKPAVDNGVRAMPLIIAALGETSWIA
jgi:hypothetical protein